MTSARVVAQVKAVDAWSYYQANSVKLHLYEFEKRRALRRDAGRSLELLVGMEQLRLDAMKSTMLGRGDFGAVARLPLPAAPNWSPLPLPPISLLA